MILTLPKLFLDKNRKINLVEIVVANGREYFFILNIKLNYLQVFFSMNFQLFVYYF